MAPAVGLGLRKAPTAGVGLVLLPNAIVVVHAVLMLGKSLGLHALDAVQRRIAVVHHALK